LVEQEVLYQASIKEGLDKDQDVQNKIDIYKKVIISQAYLDKKLQDAARKEYDDKKDEYEKLQLSHIYIPFKTDKNKNVKRSEKEALDLANKTKDRITGGEEFVVVAKEMSEDSMTKNRGGDLGFASKNEARLTRRGFGPVIEKAYTMKVAEISGPIKTEKGYHIITVTKGAELQPFEEAAQGILFKIRTNERTNILKNLKEKYKVTYEGAKKEVKKPAPKPKDVKKPEAKKEEAKPAPEKKK